MVCYSQVFSVLGRWRYAIAIARCSRYWAGGGILSVWWMVVYSGGTKALLGCY